MKSCRVAEGQRGRRSRCRGGTEVVQRWCRGGAEVERWSRMGAEVV